MDFDLHQYFGSTDISKVTILAEELAKEVFLSSEIGIHHRTLNHWEAEGILDNKRSKGQRWRRFSFLDYVWLKIIEEMRESGMPLPRIKKLKEFLVHRFELRDQYEMLGEDNPYWPAIKQANLDAAKTDEERQAISEYFDNGGWKEDRRSLSPLQLYLTNSISEKIPVRIIMFNDGHLFPEFGIDGYELPPEWEEKKWMETYTVISITGIIRSYMKSELADFKLPKFRILEKNEHRLLEMIAEGDYESITINFRDQNMHSLEMVKNQDVKKRIVDVISENKYQDIVIKNHDGMITKIQNTVKVFFE